MYFVLNTLNYKCTVLYSLKELCKSCKDVDIWFNSVLVCENVVHHDKEKTLKVCLVMTNFNRQHVLKFGHLFWFVFGVNIYH